MYRKIYLLIFMVCLWIPIFSSTAQDSLCQNPYVVDDDNSTPYVARVGSKIVTGEMFQHRVRFDRMRHEFELNHWIDLVTLHAARFNVSPDALLPVDYTYRTTYRLLEHPADIGSNAVYGMAHEIVWWMYLEENNIDITQEQLDAAQYEFLHYNPLTQYPEETQLFETATAEFVQMATEWGFSESDVTQFYCHRAIQLILTDTVASLPEGGERYEAQIQTIILDSREDADAARAALDAGEPYAEVRARFQTRLGEHNNALQAMIAGTPFGDMVFNAPIGEYVGPVEFGEQWIIFYVFHIIEPRMDFGSPNRDGREENFNFYWHQAYMNERGIEQFINNDWYDYMPDLPPAPEDPFGFR